MDKLLLTLFCFCLIAAVTAQWNNQNGQLPNFPPIDCNAPGAHCETKNMVCDGYGNCRENTFRNGSSLTAPVNFILALSCGVILAIKKYF